MPLTDPDDPKSRKHQRGSRPTEAQAQVKALALRDDGLIPNNRLPAMLYRAALELPSEAAEDWVIELFARHGWEGAWVNGIYPFHHYHSTAHEVLACISGSARVQLGGPEGPVESLEAGDVVVIPAGVGHKRVSSTRWFCVVGAYPAGQRWDMCYGRPDERPQADENIARVPLPVADPVFGPSGPLIEQWRAAR